VLYATAAHLVTGKPLRVDLVDPYWLLWFLPALAAWKLITPVYLNLRWPLALSLVVGLGVGMIERVGPNFSTSRIFSLAPFFVLGALMTPETLRRLTQPPARMAGAAVLLVSVTVVVLFHEHIGRPGALFWNKGYDKQGLSTLEGFASRGAMYVIGAVLLLALLAVMPTRRTWVAALGAASLYIYLLHGFLVRGASKFGLVDLVTDVPGLVAMLVVTTGACIALGSPWVRTLARPVVEPNLNWLLRREGDDRAPSRR
jgi:fucose 4-O-acetylase-like acetyltransferase